MNNASLYRLRQIESELLPHFGKLLQARDEKPIFLIEHGLDVEQLTELRHHVGVHARLVGLSRERWIAATLPLAIVITETGYRYSGTGTEFWPKLAEEIHAEITTSERNSIREMFQDLSKRLHFVAPNETDWARTFSIISWPIRNALAPLEIHRPLAEALARLVASGGHNLPAEDFHRKMVTIADGLWSRRLVDWLADIELAEMLCRNLLKGEDSVGWIEHRAAARFVRDIRSDSDVRSALRSARRQIRSRVTTANPVIEKASWLVEVTSSPERAVLNRILLQGPLMQPEAREAVLSAAGESASLLTKGSNALPTKLDHFLQGQMIELQKPLAAWSSQPISWTSGAVETTSEETLDHLTPAKPLLFWWKDGGGLLSQLKPGAFLQPDVSLLVVVDDLDHGHMAEPKPVSCPPGLSAWVAPAAACRPYLLDLRIRLQDDHLVEFLSTAPLHRDGKCLQASVDSTLYLRAWANDLVVRGTKAGQDDKSGAKRQETQVSKGEILLIHPTSDTLALEVFNDKQSESWQITTLPERTQVFFNCHSRPMRPTLDDFLSGELQFLVTAPVALVNTGFTLQLLMNGVVLEEVSYILSSLPARIDCSDENFKKLRENAFSVLKSLSDCQWTLRISFEGISHFTFPLQDRFSSWRQLGKNLKWVDESGATVGARLSANAISPTLNEGTPIAQDNDIQLWLPDISKADALKMGVITGSAKLFGQSVKPKMADTGRTVGKSRIGGGVLIACEAFIAWREAKAQNMLAEVRRRSVVESIENSLVRAFCGVDWMHAESQAMAQSKGFNAAMARWAIKKGLTESNLIPEIPVLWKHEFHEILAAGFTKALTNAAPLSDVLSEDDAIELDEAINVACMEISSSMERVGEPTLAEADAGNELADWQKVCDAAKHEISRSPFRNLVLPAERWHHLQSAHYEPLGDDDLVDLIMRSHLDISRQSGKSWIGSAAVRTGLLLWLSPKNVTDSADWILHIEQLLSDRHTSRAIRFVALGSRKLLASKNFE